MGEYILYHAKIWTAENDAERADNYSVPDWFSCKGEKGELLCIKQECI